MLKNQTNYSGFSDLDGYEIINCLTFSIPQCLNNKLRYVAYTPQIKKQNKKTTVTKESALDIWEIWSKAYSSVSAPVLRMCNRELPLKTSVTLLNRPMKCLTAMLHYSDQFEPESSLLKYIRQETGHVLLVLYNYNCWFHYLFVNAYVDDSVLFFCCCI